MLPTQGVSDLPGRFETAAEEQPIVDVLGFEHRQIRIVFVFMLSFIDFMLPNGKTCIRIGEYFGFLLLHFTQHLPLSGFLAEVVDELIELVVFDVFLVIVGLNMLGKEGFYAEIVVVLLLADVAVAVLASGLSHHLQLVK